MGLRSRLIALGDLGLQLRNQLVPRRQLPLELGNLRPQACNLSRRHVRTQARASERASQDRGR